VRVRVRVLVRVRVRMRVRMRVRVRVCVRVRVRVRVRFQTSVFGGWPLLVGLPPEREEPANTTQGMPTARQDSPAAHINTAQQHTSAEPSSPSIAQRRFQSQPANTARHFAWLCCRVVVGMPWGMLLRCGGLGVHVLGCVGVTCLCCWVAVGSVVGLFGFSR
jgi:hypothetical protein